MKQKEMIQLTLRIPKGLMDAVAQLAVNEWRTKNKEIEWMIRAYVETFDLPKCK